VNIIRRFKIHLLNIEYLAEKELSELNIIFRYINYCKENYELINFIYNHFFNLEKSKIPHPNYNIIWINKDNIKIFGENFNDGYLAFNNKIWHIFINKFHYSFHGVDCLIKNILKDIFNIENINLKRWMLL